MATALDAVVACVAACVGVSVIAALALADDVVVAAFAPAVVAALALDAVAAFGLDVALAFGFAVAVVALALDGPVAAFALTRLDVPIAALASGGGDDNDALGALLWLDDVDIPATAPKKKAAVLSGAGSNRKGSRHGMKIDRSNALMRRCNCHLHANISECS